MGDAETARALWENQEALDKYLARLKELMEQDEKRPAEEGTKMRDVETPRQWN